MKEKSTIIPMSKFTALIQTPTENQKDRIFGYPGFGGSYGIIEDILQTFLENPSDEKDKLIQDVVSQLLHNLSISERYKFKKMIIDVIKKDFSDLKKLTRQLNLTRNDLKRSILEGKIKIIEEDIDRLELPTGNTKEYHLKKYRPYFLPDHSISWSSKNRTVSFIEKIVLEKGFNGGEYGGLFSIDESIQRERKNIEE